MTKKKTIYELASIPGGSYVASRQCGDELSKSEPMSYVDAMSLLPSHFGLLPYKPCPPFSIGGCLVCQVTVDNGDISVRDYRDPQRYPEDSRCGDWIPLRAHSLAKGQVFMVHPQDQFRYRCLTLNNGVVSGAPIIDSPIVSADPVHLNGFTWVYVECK